MISKFLSLLLVMSSSLWDPTEKWSVLTKQFLWQGKSDYFSINSNSV